MDSWIAGAIQSCCIIVSVSGSVIQASVQCGVSVWITHATRKGWTLSVYSLRLCICLGVHTCFALNIICGKSCILTARKWVTTVFTAVTVPIVWKQSLIFWCRYIFLFYLSPPPCVFWLLSLISFCLFNYNFCLWNEQSNESECEMSTII